MKIRKKHPLTCEVMKKKKKKSPYRESRLLCYLKYLKLQNILSCFCMGQLLIPNIVAGQTNILKIIKEVNILPVLRIKQNFD